ncbi:DUF3108 domain-containing protein [Undibacterium sp. LX15W]|uniref:DUF3108 domain-containing protein n=2 Tax=Undibacterium flavidum TaxID=2762297 RepID=A0ABR6YAL9_9BURK|nr:DUF3108 domain-containing protein [Undibacterium flavidum]
MSWHLSCYAEKFKLAPSADLLYSLKSSQKGIPVSGEARINWQVIESESQAKLYRLSSETKVPLFGKILTSSSNGSIMDFGLAPDRFIEKRFRRAESTTYFDRDRKLIHFSESDLTYPIQGGEQDRLSATWQLVALVRNHAEQNKVGREWKMFVAGQRDADPWVFTLMEYTKIKTALGELDVLHIVKAPPPDAQGQKLELWLASNFDYYPVWIRFQDSNGDQLEQKIISITKPLK